MNYPHTTEPSPQRTLPADYLERVYAGVLGKLIGVYLGRPFEQWKYPRIEQELGEIWYYVHERLNVPLIVTDDDITGTFTFLRALPDYGNSPDVTPEQIGETWLNYIIERRTILWWGGVGNSTEHTVYQRLKQGIKAPHSGSIALNGTIVAEQIGAQIFIDGWGMVAPGDPAMAAELARRAGSVSHDGEAVYAAQVIAAIEASAFVESDFHRLIDTALALIPKDSIIARLIADLRRFHADHPDDWRAARELVYDRYSYERYPGNCHVVPNHALIILALLYCDDDFQKAQMIVNTCGYDTDCNAGNVGCILGIKNGLTGLDSGVDWRGPVADRLYLPTADGGRCITDAVIETVHVVNIGRALAGQPPIHFKGGARFHFELPGSVQGFMVDHAPEARGTLSLINVAGHSAEGKRSLALAYNRIGRGRVGRASTPTFISPDALHMIGYQLIASPTLYPGQTVRASLSADAANSAPVEAYLVLQVFEGDKSLRRLYSDRCILQPGGRHTLLFTVPETGGQPLASVGIELRSEEQVTSGTVYLDYLTFDGQPNAVFTRPAGVSNPGFVDVQQAWRRAWVDACDQFEMWWHNAFHIVQNSGRGLLSIGTRDWRDYTVHASIRTDFADAIGLAARVNGLRRFYAVLLRSNGTMQIIKSLSDDHVLTEGTFDWEPGRSYDLAFSVRGGEISASLDATVVLSAHDDDPYLAGGGAALVVQDGFVSTHVIRVTS